jgi:hypothetical protein
MLLHAVTCLKFLPSPTAPLSPQVKHNPFPPSVSRPSAAAAPSHTSLSSRAPPSTHANAQQPASRVDSASTSAAAASRAPAPAVFRRETISDDDEIKSEVPPAGIMREAAVAALQLHIRASAPCYISSAL